MRAVRRHSRGGGEEVVTLGPDRPTDRPTKSEAVSYGRRRSRARPLGQKRRPLRSDRWCRRWRWQRRLLPSIAAIAVASTVAGATTWVETNLMDLFPPPPPLAYPESSPTPSSLPLATSLSVGLSACLSAQSTQGRAGGWPSLAGLPPTPAPLGSLAAGGGALLLPAPSYYSLQPCSRRPPPSLPYNQFHGAAITHADVTVSAASSTS